MSAIYTDRRTARQHDDVPSATHPTDTRVRGGGPARIVLDVFAWCRQLPSICVALVRRAAPTDVSADGLMWFYEAELAAQRQEQLRREAAEARLSRSGPRRRLNWTRRRQIIDLPSSPDVARRRPRRLLRTLARHAGSGEA